MLASEDFRENPGTLALAASWVLVFGLILLFQWYHPTPLPPEPWWEPLKVSIGTGHRFGDMTWLEVRQGQSWRLLTATFIHFGLVHVAVNTLGMINLGRLVEPWYRTGPFLAICLAIGGLGNLLGGAMRQAVGVARPWLASVAASRHWPGAIERVLRGGAAFPESIASGGGSTILLGLLALGAVVGWRSRTRIGGHLQKQMVLLLALTAALGLAMPGLVDNFGHLGGAIVGGVIGLFDRPLTRMSKSRWFRGVCLAVAVGVPAACLGLAIRADRVETEYRHQLDEILGRGRTAQAVRVALNQLHYLYALEASRTDGGRGLIVPLDGLAIADLLSRGPRTGEPAKPDPDLLNRAPSQMAGVFDVFDHIIGALGATRSPPTFADSRSSPGVRSRPRRRSTRSTSSPSAGNRPNGPSPPTLPSSTPDSSNSRRSIEAGDNFGSGQT